MMQDVDWKNQDKDEKDMRVKLQGQVNAFNESQILLSVLQKDKEKLEKKMMDVKAKAKRISSEKNSL